MKNWKDTKHKGLKIAGGIVAGIVAGIVIVSIATGGSEDKTKPAESPSPAIVQTESTPAPSPVEVTPASAELDRTTVNQACGAHAERVLGVATGQKIKAHWIADAVAAPVGDGTWQTNIGTSVGKSGRVTSHCVVSGTQGDPRVDAFEYWVAE